ncbi:MAG: aminotransferase class I/II-fold pyridoxal phosphate-dependent enzyme [Vulcanimicrobiaceae bacterium]
MNPRVGEIGGSLIREIAAKRKSTSIDLGLGEPSLKPSMRFWSEALAQTEREGLKYTTNAGDDALRQAIAGHYQYPQLAHADNVCVMTGSQEAVYVAVKTLLNPSEDELLVVEPAFPAYAKMAKLEGVAVRKVAMDAASGFAFEAGRILEAVAPQTRMIVVCSPCNPTGRVIDRATVQEVSRGLLARSGKPVYVLHDEIYAEQTYVEQAGHFAASYPYTIVTNSLSKSNALTGLRLGWSMAPREIAPSIVKTHAWVTSCASTFAQRVASAIFSTPGGLQEHARWYGERVKAVIEGLEGSGLPFVRPEGTFYACIALPRGSSSLQAAHDLADRHDVIAIPGIAFGDCFEGWLRLSWVAPLEDVREGIKRIAAYCSRAVPDR